jgi:hypothetical protein
MKKILFLGTLLLASSPTLSMDALTKQTKSEIIKFLREIECSIAFGDIQCVDEPDSQEEQRKFIKNRYAEIKKILEANGISAPKGRDFSWLRSIKEELNNPINYNRKNLELYEQAQRLAGAGYKRVKKLKEKL